MQFHNILKASQAIFSHETSRKSSIEASNGESSPNYLRCVPDIVAPNEKSMFDKRFSWTFTLSCRCLSFIVNFSSGGSGKIDYTPISLLPDDAEYVRYTEESHIVSCIGEDERYLKWLRPDGAEVDVKGRVHVEAFDGQLRLIIHSIKKEDQGVWMCCRENDENDGQSFELKVYGERKKVRRQRCSSSYFASILPVPISFEPVESVITVKEDQDIAIPCDVDGYPEPATQWYHNGISLQEKLLSTSIFLLPF